MPPRRILHPRNRIICSPEANFYVDVTKLIKGLRQIMCDSFGQMHFVTLKDTTSDEDANNKALKLALDTLMQHKRLQIEGIDDKINHEMLVHMALSELDASNDATQVR